MTSTSTEHQSETQPDSRSLGGYVQEVQSVQGHSMEAVPHTGTLMAGAIFRYEVTVDGYSVGGMMNSLTGQADVEVRDIDTGDLIIRGEDITVDRIGLARFEHKPVVMRSLVTLALRAATWAEGAQYADGMADDSLSETTDEELMLPRAMAS